MGTASRRQGKANPMGGGCLDKWKGLTENTTAQGQGSQTVSGKRHDVVMHVQLFQD